jgi:ABC-2 type transport system permease protein
MIGTLLRLGWLNLKRDRVAQALTFVLPVIFFSIFAAVMGNQADVTSRVRVAVVDEDRSAYSVKLVAALTAEGGLRVQTTSGSEPTEPLSAEAAEALVRDGDVPVAIVLPPGLGETHAFWSDAADPAVTVRLLADVSDPVALQVVQGLLQKVGFTAAPEAMASDGIQMLEKYSGPLTPEQRQSFDSWLGQLESGAGLPGGGAGMTGVLFAKWLFIALMGAVQLVVMFVWGWLVFGLPLPDHLPGFVVMTAVTAPAAAGLGVLLATMSRSRAQLSGLSTIIILTMSALGGSMFPRFLMSDTMQQVGLATFNAWALDGFIKVFWRDVPLLELWPQVLVLVGVTCVFLAAARMFARRWETAG